MVTNSKKTLQHVSELTWHTPQYHRRLPEPVGSGERPVGKDTVTTRHTFEQASGTEPTVVGESYESNGQTRLRRLNNVQTKKYVL